jgi:serine/threonine protein kinase
VSSPHRGDDEPAPPPIDATQRFGTSEPATRSPPVKTPTEAPPALTPTGPRASIRPPSQPVEPDELFSDQPTLLRDARAPSLDDFSAEPTLLRKPSEPARAAVAPLLPTFDPSTVIKPEIDRRRHEERGLAASTQRSGTPALPRYREPEIGALLGGKYELLRLLGSGGMGKVWKGHHLRLGVPIAVKTMHPHVASLPEYVRRFHREAHATSLLSHPNVVRVFDFGEEEGILYLVMEYLEGRSLAAWIHRRALPPPLADVADVMAQLFDAFEVAHAYGIVHRDLKPDNVFLAELGAKTVLKVLDFGLAHVDDHRDSGPTLTSIESVAGTPEYMSPEQCRSLVVGPSADLYSLGCLLTTLLQLKPPFRSQASVETMANHMFSAPPPLDRPEGAEPVPLLLERLRLDLLAKTPERRPATAAEAKARLLEAMSAEAGERRLPGRKDEIPAGDRLARSPVWDNVNASPAARPAPTASRTIALLTLAPPGSPAGIDASCITGLSSQSIQVSRAATLDEAKRLGLSVVVLDMGHALAEAEAQVKALRQALPDAKVLVCAAASAQARSAPWSLRAPPTRSATPSPPTPSLARSTACSAAGADRRSPSPTVAPCRSRPLTAFGGTIGPSRVTTHFAGEDGVRWSLCSHCSCSGSSSGCATPPIPITSSP